MTGGELHAEGGQDAIEARVLEREGLGVTFDPVDADSLCGGPLAGGPEGLGREVEPGHLRPGERRPDRDVAGAGRDVEHVAAIDRTAAVLTEARSDGRTPHDVAVERAMVRMGAATSRAVV